MNSICDFSKTKVKWIILIICLMLSICLFYSKNKQEYIWEEIPYKNFLILMEQRETFYSVFKRNDCENCVSFIKEFKKIAKENDIPVYVIETSNMSNKQKLECKSKYDLQYVPTTYYIKKGIIKNIITGESSIEEMKKFVNNNKINIF